MLTTLLSAAVSASAESPSKLEWVRRLDDGLRLAREQQKDVLINFTGHGWCYYCTLLEEQVFGQPDFAAAKNDFVLIELDYPSVADVPDNALKELYKTWKARYLIHGFPIVVLADSHGTPYAFTGYDDGITAATFLKELAAHRARREARDRHLAAADNTEGAARARELHAAIEAVAPLLGTLTEREDDAVLVFYANEVDEICRLDADNACGLRAVYDRRRAARDAYLSQEAVFRELDRFKAKESYPDAIAYIDSVLPNVGDSAMRWRLQSARQVYLEWDHQYAAALAHVRQLIAEFGQNVERLDQLREREEFNLFKLGQVDEAIASCDRRISDARDDAAKRLRVLHWKAEMVTSHSKGESAIAACREYRSASTFPSDDWQLATRFWAIALQKDNRHAEAIERWTDLMRASGPVSGTLLQIARNQQAIGSLEDARRSLDQAAEKAKKEFQSLERHEQREALQRFSEQAAELRKLLQPTE
ncbi:MAG: thioredoxin family protein [Pirellulales bacterium]|nr:thioredoxin family protein [Pirellulales bacterium]